MNGDFPVGLPGFASIRRCGKRKPFGYDLKHGWPSPRFHLIIAVARSFSVKNHQQREVRERTSSKFFGRRLEHCSGAWKTKNPPGWIATNRNLCLRSDQHTNSPPSQLTWIDTESSRCSAAE